MGERRGRIGRGGVPGRDCTHPQDAPQTWNPSSGRSSLYAAVALLEEGKFYSPVEAVDIAKQTGSAKFNSTVEVAVKLSVDPRKADQMVRGTVMLPHGTGKTARVIVFATGPAAEAALAAGADEVGGDELIEKVENSEGGVNELKAEAE